MSKSKLSIYNIPRYWYHLSTTLTRKKYKLIPWGNDKSLHRCETEPSGERICVAPSIEQCLTALPYLSHYTFTIYRTKFPIVVSAPRRIFDSKITQEGWITIPTEFIRIGKIDLSKFKNVIEDSASSNEISESKKVLRWWKSKNVENFIETV